MKTILYSFYLPLPDLAALDLSPEDYARERLAARCPHFASFAAFADLLESRGIRLVCDGLDRIDSQAPRLFLARTATLLRDRPKVEVQIFGRIAVANELALPNFNLLPLDGDEQAAVAMQIDPWGGGSALRSFPKMLEPLLQHPLLLTLLLEYRKIHGGPPSRLDQLFETWIGRLLEVDNHSPARVARLRHLLKRFANAIGGPVRARGPVLASIGDYKDADLDALVATGALILGDQVELQHDALGDYLRAEALLDLPPYEFEAQLSQTNLAPGALFPALLMSRCSDPKLRDVIWSRVGESGIAVYLDVTRFGSSVDYFGAIDHNEAGKRYLNDLLHGTSDPAHFFFGPLLAEIFYELVRAPSAKLGVQGMITADRWVSYGYYSADDGKADINLGAPQTIRQYGVQLDRMFGAQNARALGLGQLRDALATVIRKRRLEGGPLWWNERLLGRLRFAARYWKVEVPLESDFKTLSRMLLSHANEWLRLSDSDRNFNVSEMLDDIDRLRGHGWNSLDPWWRRLGEEPSQDCVDPAWASAVLNEYGRRTQQVYDELVSHSVPALATSLSFYQAMPVRYSNFVQHLPHYGVGMTVDWFPVKNWESAGADVEYSNASGRKLNRDTFTSIMAELERFGRTGCTTVRWMSGALPRFDGSHRNRNFDGETAVLRNALDLFVEDLDPLLEGIPGSSIRSKAVTGAKSFCVGTDAR